MWHIWALVILCFGALSSDSCSKKPKAAPAVIRTDARFVEDEMPSTSSQSYTESRWRRQIQNNVDITNFNKMKKKVVKVLNKYDLDPSVSVPTDVGTSRRLDCSSMTGLCDCMLTLYTLGEPLHTGPLFYRDFNTQTRDVIQGIRPYGLYNYPTEYALINQAYEQRRITIGGPLYRGVNAPFDGRVGDTYRFNHFASTSQDQAVSLHFTAAGGTLFELHYGRGIPMSEFSQFTREEEYLIHPFEEFEVQSISTENTSAGTIKRVVLYRKDMYHTELL